MLVLVVDDEVKVRSVICQYLKNADYQTIEATNGVSALEAMKKYSVDLVILDIVLPKKDGLETCAEIKKSDNPIPVILLSAKTDEDDRIAGFDVGADDYVIKPFSPRELVARVNAVLKRNVPRVISYQGIVLDLKSHTMTVDGEVIEVNKKEFDLMKLFILNVGSALPRSEIIKNVWGYELKKVDRTIDTHVKMLRAKMGKYSDNLVTIRGVGYKLNA